MFDPADYALDHVAFAIGDAIDEERRFVWPIIGDDASLLHQPASLPDHPMQEDQSVAAKRFGLTLVLRNGEIRYWTAALAKRTIGCWARKKTGR